MIQCGNGLRLALKTLAKLSSRDFDRDIAIQPRIARSIHLAHSARADGRKDFVRTEFVAYRQRHKSDSAQFTRSKNGLVLLGNRYGWGIWSISEVRIDSERPC